MDVATLKFYQDHKDVLQQLIDQFDVVRQYYQTYLTEAYSLLKDQGLLVEDFEANANEEIGQHAGAYLYLYQQQHYNEPIRVDVYLFAELGYYGIGIYVNDGGKKKRSEERHFISTVEFVKKYQLDFQEHDDSWISLMRQKGNVPVVQFVQEVSPILRQLESIVTPPR